MLSVFKVSLKLIQEMRNSIWRNRHGTLCVCCHAEPGATRRRIIFIGGNFPQRPLHPPPFHETEVTGLSWEPRLQPTA